jgi:hypothetical protein
MKKNYLTAFLALACIFTKAQTLTVTTAPTTGTTICASNATTVTATAVPVGYTVSSIPNTAFDPTLFSTTILVDQTGSILGSPVVVTPSNGTLDDGRWENISLPFSFRHYGNNFSSIHISTNGWVGLGSTNTISTGYGVALPNAAAPNNVIHAITCDLDFRGITNAATLQYFTVGTAPNRKFVIDYANLKFISGTATATVQIILYETSNVIEVHTTSCTNTAASKAQGIENSTGTAASVSTGRNNTANWAVPLGGNAFRFTPDNITFTWSPAAGLNTTTGATVIASPAATTVYNVVATNTVNGQTGNTNFTVTVDPASNTLAGTAGGAQICRNVSVSPSGTNYRDGNCNLIARLLPTGGATALANSVNTCIKVETGASSFGTATLYAARHYDIDPIANASTATANVVLYYLQTEFNNYNTLAPANNLKLLPTNPTDAAGISNLILRQFHGTGTLPANYTGATENFTTATSGFSVVWNSSRSWWEVTVPVNGFSGFYLTSATATTLPITLQYFNGVQTNDMHQLNWKVNCLSSNVTFDIERSADGQKFSSIGTITASRARCSQPFESNDSKPLSGINYYRIKIIDEDGSFYYSNIISFILKTSGFNIIGINPNPVVNDNALLKINSGEKAPVTIRIADINGRILRTQAVQLLPGLNTLPVNVTGLAKGLYHVTVFAANQLPATVQLLKQ